MEISFGEVIHRYKTSKGMTLRELANRVGVAPSFISMMENNHNVGTAKEATIKKLAEYLNINERQLLHLAKKTPEADLLQLQTQAFNFFEHELKTLNFKKQQ